MDNNEYSFEKIVKALIRGYDSHSEAISNLNESAEDKEYRKKLLDKITSKENRNRELEEIFEKILKDAGVDFSGELEEESEPNLSDLLSGSDYGSNPYGESYDDYMNEDSPKITKRSLNYDSDSFKGFREKIENFINKNQEIVSMILETIKGDKDYLFIDYFNEEELYHSLPSMRWSNPHKFYDIVRSYEFFLNTILSITGDIKDVFIFFNLDNFNFGG